MRTACLAIALACPAACSAPNTPSPTRVPSSPIEGIIVAVDASNLTDVRGLTIRTHGGTLFTFKLGQLENPTEFPPGHLKEHQATSSPVLVFFRVEAGQLVVYRLEDADPRAT